MVLVSIGAQLVRRADAFRGIRNRREKTAGKPDRALTTEPGRFNVRRARLAPAMISTPGHWASQKAPTRGPCQPGLHGYLLGTVSSCYEQGYCLLGRGGSLWSRRLLVANASWWVEGIFDGLPCVEPHCLLAGILILSPVCGFRPSRAGRAATLKVPRPETRTGSPATRDSRTACTTAFTASVAVSWVSVVF